MIVVGVDLSAKPSRASGVAVLRCRGRGSCSLATYMLYGDVGHIAERVAEHIPHIVVIDAPLACPSNKPFRETERKLIRLGARLLPLTMPAMRKLCRRGTTLYKMLRGIADIYETHPWSSLRLSGCTLHSLLRLIGLGIEETPQDKDERDALIAAITGAGVRLGFSWILGGDAFFVVLGKGACRGAEVVRV